MITYFSYGSNMSSEQMIKRCPNCKYIGYGYLENHKIDFTRMSRIRLGGVADIIESMNEEVWGVFYSITEEDLALLDKFEGFPNLYTRFNFICNIYNNNFELDPSQILNIEHYFEKSYSNKLNFTKIDAISYVVVNKSSSTILPSLSYLNILQDAAFEHNFPIEYQKKLNSFGIMQREEINSKILDLFLQLNDNITSEEFAIKCNSVGEFGGANLVITNSFKRKMQLNNNYPSDLVVFTPYNKELSWLVSEIYNSTNTQWLFNSSNKYLYFKEVGEALIEYQEKHPNDVNHIGICQAGLIKAYSLITKGGVLYVE